MLGGWLCKQLEIRIADGVIGQILTAVFGAIVLLLVIGLVKKAD